LAVELFPPEQVEVGWQVPGTPSAVQDPYVQHWISVPPGQCPASDFPPQLEQVDVSIHSPASPLLILQVWAKTARGSERNSAVWRSILKNLNTN
jgi:hypothetical protein